MQDPSKFSQEPRILADAPRCGARTRSGSACRAPAIHGARRCRMHGGRRSGAPRGNRNAWKHGVRSAWIREVARYLRATSPTAIRGFVAAHWPGEGGADVSGGAACASSPSSVSAFGALSRPAAPPVMPSRGEEGARELEKTNEQPHAPGIWGENGTVWESVRLLKSGSAVASAGASSGLPPAVLVEEDPLPSPLPRTREREQAHATALTAPRAIFFPAPPDFG